MPVYNEGAAVERCISLVLTVRLPENMDRELVIVDDCSTDGTWDTLQRLAAQFPQIQLYRQPRNRGKGAAVRMAVEKATGDFSLIQDADLEYDPSEYPRLLKPLLDGHADAREIAKGSIQPVAAESTMFHIDNAPSPAEALALLFASPEFQRR